VVIAISFLLVFLLMRGKGQLEAANMLLSSENTVVIIRDETSVGSDRYSRIHFAVEEGSVVAEGDVLATTYKWGFSEEQIQSLISTRSQILSTQRELLAGVTNAELASLDLQIQQKQLEIRNVLSGKSEGDSYLLEQELNQLLQQRMRYVKDLVQPNEALNSLYSSESSKLSQIEGYQQNVVSPRPGRVSFYLDGYEQVLNMEKMDTINAALIASTAKKGSASTGTVENMVCRVVNEEHWYIAFVTPQNSPWRLAEGESYTVRFEGYAKMPYVGKALAPTVSDSGVLNMIEFTTNIGDLVDLRSLKAEICMEASGFEVSLEAIKVKDGYPKITVQTDAGSYEVLVEVLSVDEEAEKAIIRSAEADKSLYEGMRYIEG